MSRYEDRHQSQRHHSKLESFYQEPPRQSLACGMIGDQLWRYDRGGCLAVRRPQLTWRLLGYAEAQGLQLEHIDSVIHYPSVDLSPLVLWNNEVALASVRAWRAAERHVGVAFPAKHTFST
jgi:hypothetical protein